MAGDQAPAADSHVDFASGEAQACPQDFKGLTVPLAAITSDHQKGWSEAERGWPPAAGLPGRGLVIGVAMQNHLGLRAVHGRGTFISGVVGKRHHESPPGNRSLPAGQARHRLACVAGHGGPHHTPLQLTGRRGGPCGCRAPRS